LLIIGHATRDLLPDGDWRLGGTAVYAALTAQRLGCRPAIVTAGPPDLLAALRVALPGIPAAALPSAEATTFENRYDPAGRRHQYLRGRAVPLGLTAVPDAWRAAPLVLLAPLAREVDPRLAGAFPMGQVAATPQGWLRTWDPDGHVRHGPWQEAERVLPHLAALILSHEDLLPTHNALDDPSARAAAEHMADERLATWARRVPLLVVTRGAEGADLLSADRCERIPAYPVRAVDPTGAGDVFAAAFLCALREMRDPRAAADFACCAASFAVERVDTSGIPTREQIDARLGS
jgi:hypothetical protein